MTPQSRTSLPRQYWTDVQGIGTGRPTMGCPRQCGAYLAAEPYRRLVRWRCENPACGYVAYS
ncbi:hypothetical protein [Streptomyces sp. NPDC057702]|uniref:hypothetical protein n=1 Tax=unclassified Streptomyces TaxID=2593676 RepID=UPI00367B4C95